MKIRLCLFVLLFSLHANAQVGGLHTFSFLHLPSSSFVNVLGPAADAAERTSISNAYRNPALLDYSLNNAVEVNHTFWFAGVQSGYVATARTIHKSVFAGGLQYINYGKFESNDAYGNGNGFFNCSEYNAHLSWSKEIAPRYHFGYRTGFAASYFEADNAYAWTNSLGVLYSDTSKRFKAGLTVSNFGFIGNYFGGKGRDPNESLPLDIRLSVSKRLEHMPFTFYAAAQHLEQFYIRYPEPVISTSIDGSDTLGAYTNKYILDNIARHLAVGGVFHFGKSLDLQVGYNHLRRKELKNNDRAGMTGFSMGFEVKTKFAWVAYSRSYFNPAMANNSLSFRIPMNWSKKAG